MTPYTPKNTPAPTAIDRVLPNSKEAEMAVLGACLLSPREAGMIVLDNLQPSDFYYYAHEIILATLAELIAKGQSPDSVLMTEALHSRGKLEEIGGAAYLADLLSACPTTSSVEHYIAIVRDKSRLRSLIGTLSEALASCWGEHDDIGTFMDGVEAQVLKVTGTDNHRADTAVSASTANSQFVDNLAAKLEADTAGITGMATGFGKLDRMTCGLHPEYYLIAARPSVGKTTLLFNIIEQICIKGGTPCGVFSLEMSVEQLWERVYSSFCRVNSMAIRNGQVSREENDAILAAHSTIGQAPLYIDDTPSLDIAEIRRRARRMVRKYGVKAIFVDYAQLITCNTKTAQISTVARMNEVSAGLVKLKKELNIPIVVAAQLNREVEKRGESAPRLSDLKDSGAFEQDADTIMMLERKHNAEYPDDRAKTKLHIAKQRHGPCGTVDLTYREQYYRFENAAV